MAGIDRDRPLYLISVVSEMLRVHPQTLRLYEREGFITPHRMGNQRLYSEADIERLELVLNLTRELGVNRAGVDIILRLRSRLESIQREMERAMAAMDDEMRRDMEESIRRIFSEEE